VTIFVSIAAYRDLDLVPTIADCLAKARWPDELRFGICWQHAPDEAPPPMLDGDRMRLLDIRWQDSLGACWARAEVMKLYDGEEWFLQLASHHRFAQGWDALLLDQVAASGAPRPVLTTYGTPFDPAAPLPEGAPTAINFVGYRRDAIPIVQCCLRPDLAGRAAPARARFLSGHLLFAPGSFVADVPYDPSLYFYGEEISLAIRAFTSGYDLFHPTRHILWHQEPRRVTPLHWEDHVVARGMTASAAERDAASLARVERFLLDHPVGPLACGNVRSFADYEAYAGLDFRRRTATPEARRGDEPLAPPPPVPAQTWRLRIGLDRSALGDAAVETPRFWYVGIHDADDVEIARVDADRNELDRALADPGERIVIERQFRSTRRPARWTVWPVDRRGLWTERLSGPVDEDCLA
jgi:Glycosyltransferase (GlcNAc)